MERSEANLKALQHEISAEQSPPGVDPNPTPIGELKSITRPPIRYTSITP